MASFISLVGDIQELIVKIFHWYKNNPTRKTNYIGFWNYVCLMPMKA